MPVNRKMMKSMKDQYGDKKGEEVYYAMEMKNKKGYSKGGYHTMPDGTKMKDSEHKGMSKGGMMKKARGYKHGGMACGASNPASRPMKKGK
jgi:hypothetical protein